MPQTGRLAYQVKLSLNDVKPAVWRRLLVSSATELPELHGIFQIVMGWTDAHLHQFSANGQRFGAPDVEFDDNRLDESGVLISSLLTSEHRSIAYEYDFGDGWDHTVMLEKILPREVVDTVPKCIEGRRACPPENVGGVPGYAYFLEVYCDAAHPEHEEMVAWSGHNFDPERFDVDEVNDLLVLAR